MPYAVQTADLTRWFPRRRRLTDWGRSPAEGTLAVDHVTLNIEVGEIFGVIGPNGAGKTTLAKMLATLILPTSGTARVCGYDVSQDHLVKSHIGFMTCNERSFFPRLTCGANLRFYAGLENLSRAASAERIAELSTLLKLEGVLDQRYDTCSTGMKHRLALARSLLSDPELLILDEPTRSLDPLAAAQFREALYTLSRRSAHTILLVTHDLDEAVDLCDRVGVMAQGRMRIVDTPRTLRAHVRTTEICRIDVDSFAAGTEEHLQSLEDVQGLSVQPLAAGAARLELRLQHRAEVLPQVIQTLSEQGSTATALTFTPASWEQILESIPAQPEAQAEAADQAAPAAATAASPAPAAHFHPGLREPLRKAWLFLVRDIQTQLSYRLAFVMQAVGILFSVASSYFIAQLFGAQANPYLDAYGGDYFAFVLIGVAFAGYQGVALYTFSSVIQSAQTMGTLEAMLVTPTRLSAILFGSSLWSFAFTSIEVLAYLALGGLVFHAELAQANVAAATIILVLTVLSLSGIGILSACFIVVFKRGNPLNFLIASASTLLSGVYYPVAILPAWLQTLARLYPLTYALEALRRALLTGATPSELWIEIAALGGFSAVLLPLSLLAFRAAIRQARRDGSLTQF